MADLREHALAFGVQSLADVDLLTLLLGTGSAGESVALSAAALLEVSGGLSGIARLGPHGLARRGIGPAKATRVAAAVELGRRALLHSLAEERAIFDCFERVVHWAQPRLGTLEHEEVWLLSLDGVVRERRRNSGSSTLSPHGPGSSSDRAVRAAACSCHL